MWARVPGRPAERKNYCWTNALRPGPLKILPTIPTVTDDHPRSLRTPPYPATVHPTYHPNMASPLQGKRIGILVGGGPAPGINGVISSVTIEAIITHGMEVIGFQNGFRHLVDG